MGRKEDEDEGEEDGEKKITHARRKSVVASVVRKV